MREGGKRQGVSDADDPGFIHLREVVLMGDDMGQDFLGSLRALLIDLDGVMYRGDAPLAGALDAVPILDTLGIQHAFVTNNATQTPEQFQVKLARMGVPAAARDVVTSSEATALYVRRVSGPGARLCIVGEDGLRQVMLQAGFVIDDEDAAVVVVGLDRHLTYQRLVAACQAIQRGARFVATNADRALPVEEGWWPGAGAIVAAIATTTGVQPTVIGKPEPTLLTVALERLGADLQHSAIVGDQVQADIRAGRAAGIGTILVASDPVGPDEPMPDLVVRDLADLLDRLRTARG